MFFRSDGAHLKCALTVRQATISLSVSFSTASLPVAATNYPSSLFFYVQYVQWNYSPNQQCIVHIAHPPVQTHGHGGRGVSP